MLVELKKRKLVSLYTNFELSIAVRMSQYDEFLSRRNRHSNYIVTKQVKYSEIVLDFRVLNSRVMYKLYIILFLEIISHYR